MKQYLIKISLILLLVFSAASTLNASPIRSDDMAGHHNNNNDVTITEPDIVFDGMHADRHHQDNRGNIYGRYDQVPELPDGNGQIPSAPVPEPLSLVLFGMGMIGVGFLARRRTI